MVPVLSVPLKWLLSRTSSQWAAMLCTPGEQNGHVVAKPGEGQGGLRASRGEGCSGVQGGHLQAGTAQKVDQEPAEMRVPAGRPRGRSEGWLLPGPGQVIIGGAQEGGGRWEGTRRILG